MGKEISRNNYLQQKIHCVFANVSEGVVLLSRHEIDFKVNITKHDVNKNEEIKQLHSGQHANSTNSVQNPPYFSLSCENNIGAYGRVRY